MDVTFYNPDTAEDYKYLGDYGQGDYETPQGTVIIAKAKDNKTVPPTSYELVWSDEGSGANKDVSCWRPIPPSDDYVALGVITVEGYEEPATGETSPILCVHKDFVEEATLSTNILWEDAGSAANTDLRTWKVEKTGLFVAHNAYEDYPDPVYQIKEAFQQPNIEAIIDQLEAYLTAFKEEHNL